MATRISFEVGVIILVVAITIGVTLGAIAGYFGGVTNQIIMRLTDIMLTFPGIFLALAISAALGRGILNATLALSVTWWPGYCRLVEAQMLKMREEDFVAGARAIGASNARIIFRHILPNLLTAIIVKASMDFGFAVLSLAVARLHRHRRAAARTGLGIDDRGGAALHPGKLVVFDLPRPVHVHHGAGLQPARRWPARPARPEFDGALMA